MRSADAKLAFFRALLADDSAHAADRAAEARRAWKRSYARVWPTVGFAVALALLAVLDFELPESLVDWICLGLVFAAVTSSVTSFATSGYERRALCAVGAAEALERRAADAAELVLAQVRAAEACRAVGEARAAVRAAEAAEAEARTRLSDAELACAAAYDGFDIATAGLRDAVAERDVRDASREAFGKVIAARMAELSAQTEFEAAKAAHREASETLAASLEARAAAWAAAEAAAGATLAGDPWSR